MKVQNRDFQIVKIVKGQKEIDWDHIFTPLSPYSLPDKSFAALLFQVFIL